MKTTNIQITANPQNAVIRFMDYTAMQMIGSYSRNIRTGKVESSGQVPTESLMSRDKEIKSYMTNLSFNSMHYTWNELEATISLNINGENFNVNIDMHDDVCPDDIQGELIRLMDKGADEYGRVNQESKTEKWNIRIYGDNDALELLFDDTGYISLNFLMPIGC